MGFAELRSAAGTLTVPLYMPREVHRIVQYSQYVYCPSLLAGNSKQDNMPTTTPYVQCIYTPTDVIALPHPGDGRPALQAC
jgi:hypothetical protein